MKGSRKFFGLLLVVVILAMTLAVPVSAAKPGPPCVTIQSGDLIGSKGNTLVVGFDEYGYNYQAHLFSGSYVNAYFRADGFPPYTGDDATYLDARPDAVSYWAWPFRTTNLLMKWNDAWLANTDCDGDGKLDRHYDFPTYIGSGAWVTNHQWDSYVDGGKKYSWDYFSKIAAAPSDATPTGDTWVNADGSIFGTAIWGEFAIIQEVYNDTGTGDHGLLYKANPGFGH